MSNNQPHTGPKNEHQGRFQTSKPTAKEAKADKLEAGRTPKLSEVKKADATQKSNV